MSLKIAMAQINPVLGDLAGNTAKILAAAQRARAQGADLLLTPELALCGDSPEDLLLRQDFYAACDAVLETLAAAPEAAGILLLVGHPLMREGRRFDAATLLGEGRRLATCHKRYFPDFSDFHAADAQRYFAAGEGATRNHAADCAADCETNRATNCASADDVCVIDIKGVRCAVAIGTDAEAEGVAEAARAAGAQLLLSPAASPYRMGAPSERIARLRAWVKVAGLPVIRVNLVGGQDEQVFDGASFALDAHGELCCRLPAFEEALEIVEFAGARGEDGKGGEGGAPTGALRQGQVAAQQALEAEVYQALVLGVRDYLGKNGFPGALLGLSGGIDSALVLAIAVDALGADKVRAVMMPSPYTAEISLADARDMARRLGVRYEEIPIAPGMAAFETMLAPAFSGLPADTTEENIQARIRGSLLMALSNKTGALVLTTGNKSEIAVGYCTLYGDMAGGLVVLKDVKKTLVYRLARWRNSVSSVIPERIITRPPSAELKPGQTDQDSLPPYETLDAIVEAYVEYGQSAQEIIAQGFAEADVRRVLSLLRINEYKRRQAPIGIRVTRRSFGQDWRYPVTNRYRGAY